MEILFDNPFLFIILIAFISSFFKNKKKVDGDYKRPNKPVGEKQPSASPFDEVREMFKEVSRSLQNESKSPPSSSINQMYEEKKAQAQKKAIEEVGRIKVDQNIKKMQEQETEDRESKQELEINENKIVESVMWAEILGPPRAKSPYRSNYRRNRY